MSLNKTFALLGAVALSAVVAGCQKQAAAADPAAVTSAVKADEKKWNDDFKSRDQEALLAHYADDAFFIAPGVPATNGMTAIRQVYAQGLSDKNFAITFASDKVDVSSSGDLAYARGHFDEKSTDPKTGGIVSESGSYITVYKKQADGSWKAVEDIAVADPATRKTEAPKVAKPAKLISM
jgi:uncharacterized protein (TIGR02246 family)